jgi:hypothetical protein
MASFEARLSNQGLKNIPASACPSDFEFLVDGVSHRCPSIIADFLSPAIARLHSSDPSISEYSVQTPDPHQQFNSFLSLGLGSPITITPGNRAFLISLTRELQNAELYRLLFGTVDSPLTLSSAVDQIADSGFPDFLSERSIDFLATNFAELSVSELSAIPIDALTAILGHDGLKLSTEDALFDFLESQATTNLSYFALFHFVRFQYLSVECVKRFVVLSEQFWEYIDQDLWAAVSERLLLPVTVRDHNSRLAFEGIQCRMGERGIIDYLTEKAGGNVHEKGAVVVTASSACCPLKNVVDLRRVGHFGTHNTPNSWIGLEFKKVRIVPTHYSITTDHTGPGWTAVYPRSWVVEIGDDGKDWTEVDRQSDSSLLDGPDRTVVFPIAKPKECCFVRLRMTAPAKDGFHCLELKGFELHGGVIGGDDE